MSFEVSQRPDSSLLVFIGLINEKFKFPKLDERYSTRIILDLEKVPTINSLGIQKWIEWTKSIDPKNTVEMVNCPSAIVMQANMVENFLPKHFVFSSVLVPFYCNAHDVEFTEKFVVGSDVIGPVHQLQVFRKVSFCHIGDGCDVEYSIIPEKYFKFLNT